MKDLKELLNESNINESRFDIAHYAIKGGNMKYGFMSYDNNSGTLEVIQFNKLSEYAQYNGFEEEDMMGIDRLDVGESVYDGASYIYTRIW